MTTEISVEYAVLQPEPSKNPPPLVLLFHGWGQTCRSILRRFTALRDFGACLVAPQAPHPFYVSMEPKKVGFTWLTQYERDRAVEEFRTYIRKLLARLDLEASYDKHNVFIVGYSQGVSMGYRLAVSDVVHPAGLVACNADLPPDVAVVLGETTRFPILLIHGTADPLVPVSLADTAAQLLRAHGFPVEEWRHSGGHEVPPAAIQQIGVWLRGACR